MRTKYWLLGVVAVLASIAGACAGSGSGPTLEGYFKELARTEREADERQAEHKFKPDFDSGTDPLDQVRGWFHEFVAIERQRAEALAEIEPPPEAAAAHAELVTAAADLTDILEREIGRIDDIDTTSELQQFIDQPVDESDPAAQDASRRLDAACSALRDVALRYDVSVTLSC
jgi:hypothetical protein